MEDTEPYVGGDKYKLHTVQYDSHHQFGAS